MSKITVNGKTITVPDGASISVTNGIVLVDGKPEFKTEANTIVVNGNVGNINCDLSVTVNGNVNGNVNADGSISCDDIGGDVNAGGSVSCDDVEGNVKAGGSVSCDNVGGRVK